MKIHTAHEDCITPVPQEPFAGINLRRAPGRFHTALTFLKPANLFLKHQRILSFLFSTCQWLLAWSLKENAVNSQSVQDLKPIMALLRPRQWSGVDALLGTAHQSDFFFLRLPPKNNKQQQPGLNS